MSFGKRSHLLQLGFGPDTAAGIVRRTKNQHRFVAGHLGIERFKIQFITAIVVDHLTFHNFAPCSSNDACESVIYWCKKNNAVAGLGKRIDAHRRTIYQSMSGEDPFGINLPPMPVIHPPLDCVQILTVIPEIPVNTMVQHAL